MLERCCWGRALLVVLLVLHPGRCCCCWQHLQEECSLVEVVRALAAAYRWDLPLLVLLPWGIWSLGSGVRVSWHAVLLQMLGLLQLLPWLPP